MFSFLLNATQIFSYIGYILIAILILLFMVLIHELGHYVAGKILKFKINEFSVGFGPKLLQKKRKNGEIISLRAIPLGGYCAFEGEGENNESANAFNNQKPWKRLIVLFFGAFFNFLSAIIFSFILLVSCGYDKVEVKNVGSNSINYGYLQSGDIILGVDGHKINFVKDDFVSVLITKSAQNKVINYTETNIADLPLNSEYTFTNNDKTFYLDTQPITFKVKRNKKEIDVNAYVNLVYNEAGEYSGWSLLKSNIEDKAEFDISNYKYSFFEALGESVPFTFKWAYKVLVVFGQLITGQLNITALGGPVTTVKTIASYTQQNFNYIFVLLPLIAVNLAVFNLLPIPALDGCQMIFVIIEWIRKKPLKQEVVNLINNIGLFVLFGFVIIVDILQFIL